MLSLRRRRNEAVLIERYWSSLRRDRATQAPDALDSTLANVVNETDITFHGADDSFDFNAVLFRG